MSWRVLLAVAVACLATSASFARDDGRYAGSPLKPWFDELRDKNGQQCCADADGAVVKDVDWKLWLGKSPNIPFNERHFWHWRCYWRYGTGQAGDLLSHEMDYVQYILGHGIPDTCSCVGLNALLKDDREVPDTWATTYQFNKLGRTVTFTGSMNSSVGQPVEICGKDALLRFDGIAHDSTSFTLVPEGHNERKDLPKGYVRNKTPRQPNHMQDFINCVRSRGTPKCGVDEAFVEIATSLMSIESYVRRRQVRWDAAEEEIV